MKEHQVVFNFDNETFSAEIKCEDFYGRTWDIPICLSYFGKIGIDIDGAGALSLDGEGFYCYLWHQANLRYVISNYK